MNAAAARARLTDLLTRGDLERVPADAGVVENLLRQAGNHLKTATAGAADDPEGAFQLAYDACRKTCLALVMATGLRPKGQAAHIITFDAAGEIAANFGERRPVQEAADLRYIRHGAEYRAETVSFEDVEDAIASGEELIVKLTPRTEQILNSTT